MEQQKKHLQLIQYFERKSNKTLHCTLKLIFVFSTMTSTLLHTIQFNLLKCFYGYLSLFMDSTAATATITYAVFTMATLFKVVWMWVRWPKFFILLIPLRFY